MTSRRACPLLWLAIAAPFLRGCSRPASSSTGATSAASAPAASSAPATGTKAQSDVLRPESAVVLKEIADALSKNPDWKLNIEGHTDNIGGDSTILDLSRRRSASVRKALVEQHSIDAARLTTEGFGASRPKESNDTIPGRAKNRRVELVRR